MTRQSKFGRLCTIVGATLGLLCSPQILMAQSIDQPPILSVIDDNGVNLATGYLHLPGLNVSIGTGSNGIGEQTNLYRDATHGSLKSDLNSGKIITYFVPDTSDITSPGFLYNDVSYGSQIYRFHVAWLDSTGYHALPGPFPQYGGGDASFECPNYAAPVPNCALILGDGTKAQFDTHGYLASVTKPDGEVVTNTYYVGSTATDVKGLKTVSSSLGWMLKYEVNANYEATKITAINSSDLYCDPDAVSCGAANYPSASISSPGAGATTYSENGAAAYTYTTSASTPTTTITSPSGLVTTVNSYTSGTYARQVSQVIRGSSTWNYSYATVGSELTVTVTSPPTTESPSGATNKWKIFNNQIVSQIDAKGRDTTYSHDTGGRVSEVIPPDGNSITGGFTRFDYDTRGNLTKTTIVPKNGAVMASPNTGVSIVTSATYAPSCDLSTAVNSNFKYCNKPLTTTDANGVTTTFTYDPASGNVATVTLPPPAPGGVAPQTRYTYVQITPHVRNASGTFDASPPVWRLDSVSSCMTLASCSDSSNPVDQLKTSYAYDTSHALPVSTTVTHGNAVTGTTASTTTTVTYNGNGDAIVTDGPQPGAIDESYTFYDTSRRPVGSVSLDPDGTGALKRKATKTSFDDDGRVTSVETGVAGDGLSTAYSGASATDRWTQASTDWDTRAILQKDTTSFSPTNGLPITSRHYDASTVTYLSQTSYDATFRKDCVVQRMNPSVFSTITGTTACTLGTEGTSGPDRIVKYVYDSLNNVVSTTNAYGTPLAHIDFLKSFDNASATSTGTLTWVEDAKGNRTTYSYDNFNRSIKTCYPSDTTIHTSSTTNCEQVNYRTMTLAGVTQAGTLANAGTLRDGQVDTLSYDNIGRTKSKTGPVSDAVTYDNFGQKITRTQNGLTESYVYDTAGWLLSDAQEMGTVAYTYNAYGQRSQMTYPGTGLYVTYTYNAAGGLTAIKENGTTNLATYAYDDYSRLTTVSFGNGYSTAFTYDANSRLQTQNNTVSGGNNLTTLGYSQANQIVSRVQSNAIYESVAPVAGTTHLTNNGLNQLVTSELTPLTYDTRGNLTSDGAVTYTYNVNNLLTDLSTGFALRYDAENRLRLIDSASTGGRYFLYDGTDLIAEYTSAGSLVRRYVHGPGTDNAIVWYDIGTSSKYYLQADERGSITSATSASGVTQAVYSYDEYGVPATKTGSLASPFRYTGQVWLPEVGLYYYKARMYAPSLGRFMQTDPIGYDDGMNWYAYAHTDPMNLKDPSGTQTCIPLYFNHAVYHSGSLDAINSYSVRLPPLCFPDGNDIQSGLQNALRDIQNALANAAKNAKKAVEADYSKCGGETGVRGPDFAAGNFSFGLPGLFSYEVGSAVDRHGAVYFGNGFSFNKVKVGFSGSLTANYMVDDNHSLQTTAPGRSQLEQFLTGPSWSAAGGDGLGGTYSFNDYGSAVGAGGVFGASFGRSNFASKPVFQLAPDHCKAN